MDDRKFLPYENLPNGKCCQTLSFCRFLAENRLNVAENRQNEECFCHQKWMAESFCHRKFAKWKMPQTLILCLFLAENRLNVAETISQCGRNVI
jgi:hypothetical protein